MKLTKEREEELKEKILVILYKNRRGNGLSARQIAKILEKDKESILRLLKILYEEERIRPVSKHYYSRWFRWKVIEWKRPLLKLIEQR